MKQRIVSLIPSGTEILCALGFRDQLAGRSHECDFPEDVRDLPACCEPTIDITADSRQIDRAVKQTLASALSLYRVHLDRLRELQPTHLLTQSQCEVCAVSLTELQTQVCEILPSRPRILDLSPHCLSDVLMSMEQLASELGRPERGTVLRRALEQRLENLRECSSIDRQRSRMLCLEWLDPLMSAGNWVPELIELAGCQPVLARSGEHSPWLSWKEVTAADPDLIVLLPCGFDLERTQQEAACLSRAHEWRALRAVQEQQIYLADGNQFFNRPGPRLVESAEILLEIREHARGRRRVGRHEGSGWRPPPS